MQSITTSSNNSTLRKSLEKVEKIIAALFIVTDSIEHNDLVKLRVREICLDILSFMNSMDLDGELSPLIARQMSPVKCFIDEIHSILNVSRMSGLISEMNYQILSKELELFCINLDGNQALTCLLEEPITNNQQLTTNNQQPHALSSFVDSAVRGFEEPSGSRRDKFVGSDWTVGSDRYTKAYIAHLFHANEMLASTLASIHNLYFIVNLVKKIRQSILDDNFFEFKEEFLRRYQKP